MQINENGVLFDIFWEAWEREKCLKWDKNKNKELYRCHEEKGDCFVPCIKMMSFWCLFQ
jgi:hypothetical protein